MPELEINFAGQIQRFSVALGLGLSRAIWLSGKIPPVPLCNGLGLCGRCRCRFLTCPPKPVAVEETFFSVEELNLGWRLACRHTTPNTGTLALELPLQEEAKSFAITAPVSAASVFVGYDLGTTSIQWQAVAASGEIVAAGREWNPQGGAGADIISRLGVANTPGGLAQLSGLARQAFAATVMELQTAGYAVQRCCVAANSAMSCIFLQKNISGFLAAPYVLDYGGNELLDFALPNGGSVALYFPPLAAPFVGGDLTAGLCYLLQSNCEKPFLLLDLGTNAELALATCDGRLILASAPLGPAMEGIGPACGQAVGPGVITAFNVGPLGFDPVIYDDKKPVIGIGATGYLSLLAHMYNWGIMDAAGKFTESAIPLGRKLAASLADNRLNLPEGQFLTARDVEMLLKVKAALNVAIAAVLAAAGLAVQDLAKLCLAGALGFYANIGDLLGLGFVPAQSRGKIEIVGNTSLAGACLLARQPQLGEQLATLCKAAEVVDLTNDAKFLPAYLAAMRWGQA